MTVKTVLETMLLGLFLAGCGYAQRVSYSGSMQFATGSYFFEETTQSFYLTNGLTVGGERGSVTLNIPFVVQSTPWVSYSGSGYLPTGGTQHGAVGQGAGGMGRMGRRITLPDTSTYTKTSFSDPTFNTALKLHSGATSIFFNTGLKIPLADPDRGFGTGAWDFGAGLSVSRRLGTFFVIGDVMYWWLGDMDELELKDPFFYSAGLGKSFSGGKWLLLGTFNGYSRIIDDVDPPLSLNVGVGYFLSERVSINGNSVFGLSESASDFALGLGWNVRL